MVKSKAPEVPPVESHQLTMRCLQDASAIQARQGVVEVGNFQNASFSLVSAHASTHAGMAFRQSSGGCWHAGHHIYTLRQQTLMQHRKP